MYRRPVSTFPASRRGNEKSLEFDIPRLAMRELDCRRSWPHKLAGFVQQAMTAHYENSAWHRVVDRSSHAMTMTKLIIFASISLSRDTYSCGKLFP